jgi:hypothetical protein
MRELRTVAPEYPPGEPGAVETATGPGAAPDVARSSLAHCASYYVGATRIHRIRRVRRRRRGIDPQHCRGGDRDDKTPYGE